MPIGKTYSRLKGDRHLWSIKEDHWLKVRFRSAVGQTLVQGQAD